MHAYTLNGMLSKSKNVGVRKTVGNSPYLSWNTGFSDTVIKKEK